MASTERSAIETQVEGKKDQLLKHNPYAKRNPGLLMDKVFCLCTVCSVLPLLTRNPLSLKGTAHSHRQVDVKKGFITNDELLAAKGQKTFVSYGDFFSLSASMQKANWMSMAAHVKFTQSLKQS